MTENGNNPRNWMKILLIAATIATLLVPAMSADCPTCGGGTASQQAAWDNEVTNFMAGKAAESNSSAPTVYTAKVARESNQNLKNFGPGSDTGTIKSESTKEDPQPIADEQTLQIQSPQRSRSFSKALAPLSEAKNADVVLDISPNSTESNSTKYIRGAININYTLFFGEDKRQKPVSEIAKIIGDAGISKDDSVIIYGECPPCGGGPSAATYVYWLMKYLGHDDVKVLDGGIDDWVSANLPTEAEPAVLPSKVYTPSIKPELLASYDYVKSGIAQIVDSRTEGEFDAGSITGSVNIPFDQVLNGKRIKDEAALKSLFSSLSNNKPVVVYTTTGVKASMVWLALDLLGYDARLYTWQDWMDHQSLNLSLENVSAEPNPAKTGDIVKITVVFGQSDDSGMNSRPIAPTSITNGNETLLTIKGCSTCGAEGFFLDAGGMHTGNGSGVVQLGSAGSGNVEMQKASGLSGIKCTAIITSSEGATVDKRTMQQISDREFSGIWNANVAGGTYNVTIIASSPGITKIFRDILAIDVAGSTSRYKNLGK